MEYVTETVPEGVKGKVVGIPERVRETVADMVGKLEGWTVVTEEGDRVTLSVLETVIDTVVVGVKGKVVGIPDLDRVTVPDLVRDRVLVSVRETVGDVVGRFDGWTVVTPEADRVTLTVLETVTHTVGVGVKGRVVGIPDLDRVTVPDRVSDRLPERVRETVPEVVGKLEG